MKNKLTDLNNHLFEQLERLNDEDLKGDKLKEEIIRAKAMSTISDKIIQNGALILHAQKFTHEYRPEEQANLFLIAPKKLGGIINDKND